MEYRKFGMTDYKVSRMGLGCMSMSGVYGPGDDNESVATLQRAFDLGINFLDTSASYGNGHNHGLIAKVIKGRREKIVIHSKSGSPRAPDAGGFRGGSSTRSFPTRPESLPIKSGRYSLLKTCSGPITRKRESTRLTTSLCCKRKSSGRFPI